MKILYDFQILMLQRYGGISRYFYELISRINENDSHTAHIDCKGSMNYYFRDYLRKEPAKKYKSRLQIKVLRFLNKKHTIKELRNKYDIVHPTYYDPYLKDRIKGKYVLTVYDMIQELFPEYFQDYSRETKKECIIAADHIIAISESTKNDILRFFPELPEERITVIYIASDMKKVDDTEYRSLFPEKYILFVGERKYYKNFSAFSEGVAPLLDKDEDLQVVCTGGGKFSEEELNALGDKASRYHQINCDDKTLAAAYMNALCFVFPSKYEGFGIPTLEAFACDCPAVISNTSSLPEVGGDAVVYCDPYDSDSIGKAVEKVLNTPGLREELINKGRKQREKFNWDEITRQTLECYKKVIETNGTER